MDPLPGKKVDEITEADLNRLVEQRSAEGKTLEFKQQLPGNSNRDRKEFLADVSSLANSSGGFLFFGIAETDGTATEICGVGSVNSDQAKLRLESMVIDGIRPRIPGMHTHSVPLSNGSCVIVIHVPRSVASPHTIWFQKSSKFYARTSAGKYQLDVDELRAAFGASEDLAERIRSFRFERIAKIKAGDTPVPLRDRAKVVLHCIPMDALGTRSALDLTNPEVLGDDLAPLYSRRVDSLDHNLDGVLVHRSLSPEEISPSYLQLYRTGIVETVNSTALGDRVGDQTFIVSTFFEEGLLSAVSRYLRLLDRLDVESPVWVMVSLLNVRGFEMGIGHNPGEAKWQSRDGRPIDRDDLLLPEVLIDDRSIDLGRKLRPILDAVWNACGRSKSMNYDAEGNRRPPS